MKDIKIWPHLTVAIICALVAGLGVALWMDHRQTASAAALSRAARIQRVDGQVALNNGLVTGANNEWLPATPNQPFTVGDRIYTRSNSRASLAFTGRNFARLNPNTSLDVLTLADRRTQLALRDGSAIFDVGYLYPGELFEVATPYGAVDFDQPGLYNVGIGNGSAIVSVLSGLAQVVGLGGSGQISKGEMLTLLGQTAANVLLSRLNNRDAGYLLDDYYGYQYPDIYDGRYSDYSTYLSDPYYFDPYRRDLSYQYVTSLIPGINDLDYYGNWQNLNGYGYAWQPRVDSGWAPYQQGYWMTDYPYGPTWVSTEPWGYAPYHYGRWADVGNRWYWIPDPVKSVPSYSPALVGFVPFTQANEIGWVPLAPGDAYAPRYYNQNWEPQYLSRTSVIQSHLRNLEVPGAVTVIPIDDFDGPLNERNIRRADRRMLAGTTAVLDPLTLTPLRNAVRHSAWGRGKVDLPPGIAKKLDDTRVVTSTTPFNPASRRDFTRAMRVEAVPEKAKWNKFKVEDQRQGREAGAFNSLERRERRIDRESPQRIKTPGAEIPRRGWQRRGSETFAQREVPQATYRKEQRNAERWVQQPQAERVAESVRQQARSERLARRSEQQPRPEVVRPNHQRSQPEFVRSQAEAGQREQWKHQRVERQPAVQEMRGQQGSAAIERHGPPVQMRQERKAERQQAAADQPQEQRGKGRGKKP